MFSIKVKYSDRILHLYLIFYRPASAAHTDIKKIGILEECKISMVKIIMVQSQRSKAEKGSKEDVARSLKELRVTSVVRIAIQPARN